MSTQLAPRRHRRRVLPVVLLAWGLGAVAGPPATASADQTVVLRGTFEPQRTSASFRVPDGWSLRRARSASGVTMTAPSRRPGCRHVLQADLNALYVSPVTTAAQWVRSRLGNEGPLLAMGGSPGLVWGVAARRQARSSSGSAARVTGSGHYGLIMSEVRFTTSLAGSCPLSQGANAAKRLTRLLPSLAIAAVKKA